MALDGIFLYAITTELRKEILNSKVDKVNQPEKDEIILGIRGTSNKKLLLSASSNYPRIHFTSTNKSNPMQPPMFCMVLRKYLIGSKIVDIRQLNGDRILVMDFESIDEMGFNSLYSLIIEIMGRHSNITLLRKRDNIIMDSIKHITPDINSYRSLYPSIEYVYPPDSKKLDPLSFNFDELSDFLSSKELNISSSIFSEMFSGVSKPLSKEIFNFFQENNIQIASDNITDVYDKLKLYFNELKNNNFRFTIYADNADNYKEFYCLTLKTMSDYKQITFETASKLLDNFYYEKDKQDRLNQKSADLQRLINTNIDRCLKKSNILKNTIAECAKKDSYQLFGELLTANIYGIKKGDKKAEVLNYYSETEEYMDIPLDMNKTPSENIQYYFKKYNKLKKSEEAALEQFKSNEEETDYLQSVLTNIRNCENYEEIDEIRKELVETGYIRFKKQDKKAKPKAYKPIHFISSDGIDIFVGKNNMQNDFLTLKFADKNDTWLHTKNIPGSHVIIKQRGPIPEKTLEEAAILAAFYSKAKDSTKVPVDYTEVKNVRKPSGSKPGMVIYYTNKTIYVDPYDIKLQKV